MSRLASKPIRIPDSVTAEVKGDTVSIKGPKGQLEVAVAPEIEVKIKDGGVEVTRKENGTKAFLGLVWSMINNAVIGVTEGYSRKLEVVGKGWRSTVKGNNINLQVGYSHPVDFTLPEGVSATQENPGSFTLHSHDKHLLGQVCANIQRIRPVEPYKQKGIRLEGQYIRKKVRKTVGV